MSNWICGNNSSRHISSETKLIDLYLNIENMRIQSRVNEYKIELHLYKFNLKMSEH